MFHLSSMKNIFAFSFVFFLSTNTYLQPMYGVSNSSNNDKKDKDNPGYVYKVKGFTVTYENTSPEREGYSFIWDFGDGTVTDQPNNVEHTYDAMGYFQTCLTVLNEKKEIVEKKCKYVEILDPDLCETTWEPVCGCDNQTYVNTCFAANYYGVYYWVPGPCSEIDYTLTPDFTYERYSMRVQYLNTSVGNYDNYVWNLGDGNITEQRNPLHHYKAAGTYHVCLTVSSLVTTLERQICYDVEVCDTPMPPSAPLIDTLKIRLPDSVPK